MKDGYPHQLAPPLRSATAKTYSRHLSTSRKN